MNLARPFNGNPANREWWADKVNNTNPDMVRTQLRNIRRLYRDATLLLPLWLPDLALRLALKLPDTEVQAFAANVVGAIPLDTHLDMVQHRLLWSLLYNQLLGYIELDLEVPEPERLDLANLCGDAYSYKGRILQTGGTDSHETERRHFHARAIGLNASHPSLVVQVLMAALSGRSDFLDVHVGETVERLITAVPLVTPSLVAAKLLEILRHP